MSRPSETPVLILGGGPVGLSVALELGRRGIPVVVAEARPAVHYERPRAKTTSARTMELFRRWGVADDIRTSAPLSVSWSQRVTFCTTVTGPELTHIDGCFGLDLEGSDLVAEPGQQVAQPVVEEVLGRHVSELDSVTLLLGWVGRSVETLTDGALVVLEDGYGATRTIFCRYLVGADGPRSLVRRHLGLRYVGGLAGRSNVNVTFRSSDLAPLIPHPPSVHYWVLHPDAPGVVGPLNLDGSWWAISTGIDQIANHAEARAIVRQMVGADIDVEVGETDPWQAKSLLVESYRVGRAFLVGDAAHQNPPWGGHGYNMGIGDAMNLGWKLAAVLQGWAPETLLDSYETERRPIARQTIELAEVNANILSTELVEPDQPDRGADAMWARERAADTIHRTKDPEFHSLGLVLGYGYTAAAREQSPTPQDYRPIAAPGNRLPHCWLPDGTSLYDRLGTDLTVIGRGTAIDSLLRTARTLGIPLHALDPTPGQLERHLGSAIVLVRPDQHIAWAGDAATVEQAEALLRKAVTGFDTPAAAGLSNTVY